MTTLRQRLQRLRRQLPASVTPARRPPPAASTTAAALPGQVYETKLGAFQLIETLYPPDFSHGSLRLADFRQCPALPAARLTGAAAAPDFSLDQAAFVDIETTGLDRGAGTLAFLVGVGYFTPEQFCLRQYFLRDPGEEEAMLTQLAADVQAHTAWVTFNGRGFDIPILETRFTLQHQRGALGQRPNLDLLPPARRLYRGRLPGCSLGQLEQAVLDITRDQADVPGELIPQMYLDYLRTGETDNMRRVIYHNTIDILSMVTLATHLLPIFNLPFPPPPAAPPPALSPALCLRLAGWHEDQSRLAEAEAAYRQAQPLDPANAEQRTGLARFAALLKRQNRRVEAAPLWQQLAAGPLPSTPADLEPFIELAKFYEWHAPDIPQAAAWTERALAGVATWPRGWLRSETEAELQHRLERLRHKLPA